MNFERDALDDAQRIPLQLAKLSRIITHQAQRRDAEVSQDLRANVVSASVDG
jgi:hypothetical protein